MQEWNDLELQLLADQWGARAPESIRRSIFQHTGRCRSVKSIRVKASRLGLSSPPTLHPEDEDLIVQLLEARAEAQSAARALSDEKIADKFGVRPSVVTRIRRSMREETDA